MITTLWIHLLCCSFVVLSELHFPYENASDGPTPSMRIIPNDGLTHPFHRCYVMASGPVIDVIEFRKTLGGFVEFDSSSKGPLPQETYTCGYSADQQQPATVRITLDEGCKTIVDHSNGYYDKTFLNGIIIEDTYEILKIPKADNKGYDEYFEFSCEERI